MGYTEHSDITYSWLKFTTKINDSATVIPSAHVWVPLALSPCRASISSIQGPFSSYNSLAFPETWLKAQYLGVWLEPSICLGCLKQPQFWAQQSKGTKISQDHNCVQLLSSKATPCARIRARFRVLEDENDLWKSCGCERNKVWWIHLTTLHD